MAWIEVHDNLCEHPKIFKLSGILKIERTQAAGILVFLWTWALRMAQDGELTGFPVSAVANAAGWTKSPKALINALVTAGWLDREGDRLFIHDWMDYAGRLVQRRQENAERMRLKRAKSKENMHNPCDNVMHNVPITCDARAGATIPNPTLPNPTVPYNTGPDRTEQYITVPYPTAQDAAQPHTTHTPPNQTEPDTTEHTPSQYSPSCTSEGESPADIPENAENPPVLSVDDENLPVLPAEKENNLPVLSVTEREISAEKEGYRVTVVTGDNLPEKMREAPYGFTQRFNDYMKRAIGKVPFETWICRGKILKSGEGYLFAVDNDFQKGIVGSKFLAEIERAIEFAKSSPGG